MKETLFQQDKSLTQNDEMCEKLVKEINGTRILIKEIINIVDSNSKKLNFKNEQIENTRKQVKELIDMTLPILNNTKALLNQINLEELIELK